MVYQTAISVPRWTLSDIQIAILFLLIFNRHSLILGRDFILPDEDIAIPVHVEAQLVLLKVSDTLAYRPLAQVVWVLKIDTLHDEVGSKNQRFEQPFNIFVAFAPSLHLEFIASGDINTERRSAPRRAIPILQLVSPLHPLDIGTQQSLKV